MTRERACSLVCVLAAVVTLMTSLDEAPIRVGGRDAEAVIGRPLTPVSYAGVARRTTRRAAYRAGAYAGAYAAPYPGSVAALPGGCVYGAGVYTCGTAHYRPYYDGPNVVYVVAR